MRISFWKSDRLTTDERQIVARFNKIFLDQMHQFRAAIGELVALQAAKGALGSGATIKAGYRELASAQDRAVDDCLKLISNKTDHDGRKRKRLLNLLRNQVRGHSVGFGRMAEERLLKVGGAAEGDARASADRLFRSAVAESLDKVDQYDDGLTAPKNVRWHQRHPFAAGAIGALIATLIGTALALISGQIEFATQHAETKQAPVALDSSNRQPKRRPVPAP